MKDKRNFIIILLLLLIISLSFSFVSYSTRVIEISSNGEYKKWDVGITNVETIENGSAKSGNTKYSEGTLVINPILHSLEDSVEYQVTISNNGLLSAKLERSLYSEKNPNSSLVYEYEDNKKIINRGEEIVITIKAKIDPTKYNGEEKVENELTALFDYIQN